MFEKLKGLIKDEALYMAATVIMVALSAFGLGRMSAGPEDTSPSQIRVESSEEAQDDEIIIEETSQSAEIVVVASKNSNKYHLLTCPGAKQISEQNKITFTSIAAAEAAGLTRAGNCK